MAKYNCYACNKEINKAHLFVASNGNRYPVCRHHKNEDSQELNEQIKNNKPHLFKK